MRVIAEQCAGRGADGVVCAAAPLAAQAGAAVLRDGGNAFDAVVAAALAETVLLPSKCGLAGDLIAITARAGSAVPEALLAIGGAPAGLAAVATSGKWSDTGPFSVGPPGAPAGYLGLAALANHPLDRLADAAIRLASRGFPWAAVNHRLTLASLTLLRRWNPDGTTYLPGDEPIAAGALVRLPGVAAALSSFVERREEFLAGPVGDAIVATVTAHGGVLTRDDLLGTRAEWTGCDEVRVLDRTIWATPAPTYGPTLLAAVRDAAVGDDLATQYRRVLDAISVGRDTLADPSGTSIVSAADRDGNCVVVIHSNSYPRYGSGLVAGEFDLVLANRAGRGFHPDPGHPNFPVAGRRPTTTLHACDDRDRRRSCAARGDPWWRQPGAVERPAAAGDHRRRERTGCSGDGTAMGVAPVRRRREGRGRVRCRPGRSAGRCRGPGRGRVGRWALPCAQQVIGRERSGQAIVGAADPRTVGLALGV